jgi:hypothetical protein
MAAGMSAYEAAAAAGISLRMLFRLKRRHG